MNNEPQFTFSDKVDGYDVEVLCYDFKSSAETHGFESIEVISEETGCEVTISEEELDRLMTLACETYLGF